MSLGLSDIKLKSTRVLESAKKKIKGGMPIESWSRCQRIRRNIPNAMKRMLYRDDYRDLFSIQKRYPDIYFRHSVYSANDMYGHSRILKQYANYKKQIMGCIEHGLYFGRKTFEGETTNSGLPGIITFPTVNQCRDEGVLI